MLTLAGIAAAAAGAVASVAPGAVTVRATPGAYEIGGSRLTATAPGVYEGSGGAALVIVRANGATRAGASAVLNGVHMTGSCTMPDGDRTERCLFTLDGQQLGAVDSWAGGRWRRRYDDGRTVDITVATARAVPVPFAVGR